MTDKNKTDSTVNENLETKNRRALLKGLLAGSAVVSGSKALPEKWSKPLTDAVILPSHATTTHDTGGGDFGDGNGFPQSDNEDIDGEYDGEEDFVYGDFEISDESATGDKYGTFYDGDGTDSTL